MAQSTTQKMALDYLTDSYAAQRLELLAKSDYHNVAVDALAARPQGAYDGLHFFWATKSVFSQWHQAAFTLRGINYSSAEQYMMYQKAFLFQDKEHAELILATTNSREQKELGRRVRNYDDATWRQHARRIVYEGNCGKFLQDPTRKAALLATGKALLVEAAPNDKVWGIGLGEDEPNAQQKETWAGSNWLGYVLTLLREDVQLLGKRA